MSKIISGLYPIPKGITNKKIALFGGSFDPAHSGHVAVTKAIKKRIEPDYLIWLVTPKNPLKSRYPADLTARMKYCQKITEDYDIIISDCESYLEDAHTYRTIEFFKDEYANNQLYWVMGADNMLQINRWQNWQTIFKNTCVVVVKREISYNKILECPAGMSYNEISCAEAKKYGHKNCWCFLDIATPKISSTEIRKSVQ